MGAELRVADVLGALSLATDLGSGVPFEKGLRTAIAASALSSAIDASVEDQRATYYAALLRALGCTATSRDFAALFDDDVSVQRELKTFDFGDDDAFAAQLARFGEWSGGERAAELRSRLVSVLPLQGAALGEAGCEVSAALGTQLGLPAGAVAALAEVYERWDGGGAPARRGGDELTLAARTVHVAEQAVMAHYTGGREAAEREVARRAAGHLDPVLCEAFAANADEIFDALGAEDLLARAVDAEPPPAARVGPGGLTGICIAFGTFADLKGTHLLGHSQHVAALADAAAAALGMDDGERQRLALAAQLHDLGRVGVPSSIWDRPGSLGAADWERVRLHPYWTGRILSRCAPLREIQELAASHHERLDGEGYPRRARALELSLSDRLLAAADTFAAATEGRPHRPALTPEQAAAALAGEVSGGRLDGSCVAALTESARLPRVRSAWPCDLTTREVDVLRLTARGLTNREIGAELFVSARTVQHHLASIYDKTGQRTRAGAAVFAMQHALVPAGPGTATSPLA